MVADVRIAPSIQGQRKGGMLASNNGTVHYLDTPARTVAIGILQAAVILVIVTDMRVAGTVQGQGGVLTTHAVPSTV